MPQHRSQKTFVLAIVGLTALNSWFGWECLARREQALDAQTQVASVKDLARKIEGLRAAPVRVEEGARSDDAIGQLVESKVKSVNLRPDQIVHIIPGEPRRIADLPYVEQATAIELREAPLKQIVEFTIAIGSSGPGVTVPSLSLSIPPGSAETAMGEERWNAQLTLTSCIYAPKIPAPSLSTPPIP